MAAVRVSEVMFDRFNVDRICVSVIYRRIREEVTFRIAGNIHFSHMTICVKFEDTKTRGLNSFSLLGCNFTASESNTNSIRFVAPDVCIRKAYFMLFTWNLVFLFLNSRFQSVSLE